METGIKRLLTVLLVTALTATAANAQAQTPDDFDSQFEAFRQKAAAARDAGQAPATRGEARAQETTDSPVAAPTPPNAVANPLGPAATLPVGPARSPVSAPLGGGMLDAQMTPEEMAAAAEAEAIEQQRKIDEETFNEALKMLLPMKPEQIRRMLETFKDSREAAETPVAVPDAKVQVETISLDPSQSPPVIKTAPSRVTTLTVLDATGAPWPIQDVSWAGKFEVTGPEEGGHVIRITPQTAHGMGNISIRLIDLITPVTFTLRTGLDEVYYRFDARIPKQGPLAKTPLIAGGGLKAVVGGDENLVQILDGTPPAKAQRLKVDGVDGRTTAWRLSGQIYLRTPLTLLSPSWDSSVSSADGMNVYTLGDAPVLLLSDEGRMVRANIAPDEVTYDR